MIETMRWFGPADPVPLSYIAQAGARGVVTALHHIPNGEIWTRDEIKKRKSEIEFGTATKGLLRWEVVESVPVHENIKKGKGNIKELISNYKKTLENLAAEGIQNVCYNFMPVLDWSRTDLDLHLPDGSKALFFHYPSFAAFDIFILKRPGAPGEYPEEVIKEATSLFQSWNDAEKRKISDNILRGLPGAEEHFSLDNFLDVLADYEDVSDQKLKQNLIDFLGEIAPLAQSLEVKLSIHPDDPPFPLLGLPRVMSTAHDLKTILSAVDVPVNGFCFCTGSFGARPDNNLAEMVSLYGDRMHFIHLRSVKKDTQQPKSFFEADHLEGDADMVSVIYEIKKQEKKRFDAGRQDFSIPMRPDHGHQMLDDLNKNTNPGYSAIGRLRGLAELRGIEKTINQFFDKGLI